MRLIDADAVKADIEKFNRPLCDGYHMKDYVLNQIITDIENQPTVKAIPVEWIKKYVDDKSKIDHDWLTWGVDVLHMLEDWEKENE